MVVPLPSRSGQCPPRVLQEIGPEIAPAASFRFRKGLPAHLPFHKRDSQTTSGVDEGRTWLSSAVIFENRWAIHETHVVPVCTSCINVVEFTLPRKTIPARGIPPKQVFSNKHLRTTSSSEDSLWPRSRMVIDPRFCLTFLWSGSPRQRRPHLRNRFNYMISPLKLRSEYRRIPQPDKTPVLI